MGNPILSGEHFPFHLAAIGEGTFRRGKRHWLRFARAFIASCTRLCQRVSDKWSPIRYCSHLDSWLSCRLIEFRNSKIPFLSHIFPLCFPLLETDVFQLQRSFLISHTDAFCNICIEFYWNEASSKHCQASGDSSIVPPPHFPRSLSSSLSKYWAQPRRRSIYQLVTPIQWACYCQVCVCVYLCVCLYLCVFTALVYRPLAREMHVNLGF